MMFRDFIDNTLKRKAQAKREKRGQDQLEKTQSLLGPRLSFTLIKAKKQLKLFERLCAFQTKQIIQIMKDSLAL